MIAPLLVLAAIAVPAGGSFSQDSPLPKEDRAMKPKFRTPEKGWFPIAPAPKIIVGPSVGRAGAPLSEAIARLQHRLGSGTPTVLKGKATEFSVVLSTLPEEHIVYPDTIRDPNRLGDEGYRLAVTPKRIGLTADHPAGLFRGIQRLTEEIGEKGVPCGVIEDWPSLAWRGMHVLVSGHSAMPDLRKLMTEQLPALRMNRLILEINYSFQYRSHPELVGEDPLTLEDCRELKKLADRNFVEIVPMLNCLGHQSWDKETFALVKKHPDFDETPDVPADNKGIYCRSWCPSNPDVNKVVFALIDELIDAFQARSFHVGMDEVFLIGKCPRCKDQSTASLFAKAVNDLHAHVVGKRHVEMQMWGDRLLDGVATKYGEWEASTNGTAPAIDLIPKDIVLCDWHYETPAEFPSIPLFQQKGFRTVPSGWNRVENVKLLTASAFRHRGPKLIGYLATTWLPLEQVVRGLSGGKLPADPEHKNADLPAAIRLGARTAWEGKSP